MAASIDDSCKCGDNGIVIDEIEFKYMDL